eukprot:gene2407-2974_t
MFSAIFIIGSISILSFNGGAPSSDPSSSFPEKWRNLKLKSQNYHGGNNIPTNKDKEKINKELEINRLNRIDQVYQANEELNKERALAVKNAMKHAWDNYEKYAWGADEFRPIQKTTNELYGMGLSIVDSLDTLYIMGLMDEFKEAKDWVANDYNPHKNTGIKVSVFETIIRVLGGFLATYELSEDAFFLEKAEEIGLILLKSFDNESVFPKAALDIHTGVARFRSWAGGGCAILSELGTLFLEFNHLSKSTGNPIWSEKADRILEALDRMNTDIPGLYPTYISPRADQFCNQEISFGAMGDSFYEYLLKMWIYYGNGKDPKAEKYQSMYMKAADSAIEKMYRVSKSNFGYLTNLVGLRPNNGQEHLACFAGGMFGLGAAVNISGDDTISNRHMEVAKEITRTCAESYMRSPSGLGPEMIVFDNSGDMKPGGQTFYILRPETVESLFILYRLTGDTVYQEYGWRIFESIEKHCRLEDGYVGLKNVYNPDDKDDLQQSFFMAETLKYLYLLFTDSSVIPLDKYVFNTEAHPIPIQMNN